MSRPFLLAMLDKKSYVCQKILYTPLKDVPKYTNEWTHLICA